MLYPRGGSATHNTYLPLYIGEHLIGPKAIRAYCFLYKQCQPEVATRHELSPKGARVRLVQYGLNQAIKAIMILLFPSRAVASSLLAHIPSTGRLLV